MGGELLTPPTHENVLLEGSKSSAVASALSDGLIPPTISTFPLSAPPVRKVAVCARRVSVMLLLQVKSALPPMQLKTPVAGLNNSAVGSAGGPWSPPAIST